MGLQEPSNKIYLRISNGRICKTVKEGTPKAQVRETSKGDVIWELVWESLSGTLDAITFRDHPEYGKTWTLTVLGDGIETYALQVNEDSRYGIDLLKKIPNMRHGLVYTFRPYEFERNGKRKCGINIETNGQKVQSYYQKFTDKGNGEWLVENLHDYPPFEGDSKDKDELKIYFIKLAKFLRTNAIAHIQGNFQTAELPAEEKVKPEPTEDLPF